MIKKIKHVSYEWWEKMRYNLTIPSDGRVAIYVSRLYDKTLGGEWIAFTDNDIYQDGGTRLWNREDLSSAPNFEKRMKLGSFTIKRDYDKLILSTSDISALERLLELLPSDILEQAFLVYGQHPITHISGISFRYEYSKKEKHGVAFIGNFPKNDYTYYTSTLNTLLKEGEVEVEDNIEYARISNGTAILRYIGNDVSEVLKLFHLVDFKYVDYWPSFSVYEDGFTNIRKTLKHIPPIKRWD